MPEAPAVSVPDSATDPVTASVPDSVWVVCVFFVSAASFPLHAVSNNATLSVKTGIKVLLVLISYGSFYDSIM